MGDHADAEAAGTAFEALDLSLVQVLLTVAGRVARTGEAGGFKDPSALCQHQFDELLKRTAALQPEQFLDVLRPVSVHPLLKISLRELISQEERRQSPA